ncbi:MAG: tRNA dihydrouridine(20/20a) synthase DusA [Rheinheimera sp.]|nr:tRNA dihydrouridine(20/20a) synthase DusA [Rheinheimera sp.]
MDHKFSIAPMLDWTDRHCRYFHRMLSQHAVLYTEMITTGALIYGQGDYLAFNEEEHPVVVQLGGSDPEAMVKSALMCQQRGYDAININVGCPSDRVQNGMFGACLMAQPKLVAECVQAMRSVVDIPVTVKTRIGIDDQDSYQFLVDFVGTIADAGCQDFIIHARKAWLSGTKSEGKSRNSTIRLPKGVSVKTRFPCITNCAKRRGEDLGRLSDSFATCRWGDGWAEAYTNPLLLDQVDAAIYGDGRSVPTPHQVVRDMLPYIEQQMAQGARFWHIARHMLGIFQGVTGARQWRRHLSEVGHLGTSGPEVMLAALAKVPE